MVAVVRWADPRHCRTCVGQGHARRGRHRAASLRPSIRAPGRGAGFQKLPEQSQLFGEAGEERAHESSRACPLHSPPPHRHCRKDLEGEEALWARDRRQTLLAEGHRKKKKNENPCKTRPRGQMAQAARAGQPRAVLSHVQRAHPQRAGTLRRPVAASGSGGANMAASRPARTPRAAAHHPQPAPRPTSPSARRRPRGRPPPGTGEKASLARGPPPGHPRKQLGVVPSHRPLPLHETQALERKRGTRATQESTPGRKTWK